VSASKRIACQPLAETRCLVYQGILYTVGHCLRSLNVRVGHTSDFSLQALRDSYSCLMGTDETKGQKRDGYEEMRVTGNREGKVCK
jgi:hypothetical protein